MVIRYADPFDALFAFQRALENRLTSNWMASTTAGSGSYPPVNVFAQGEDLVAIVEIPGVDKGDLNIEAKGNTVRIAGTASDALACAAEEPFDLVVSDVGLPDASGYELMQQLRDRFALKGIALTGTRETDRVKAAGFVAFLSKPIALRTLEQTLASVAADL